MQMELTKLHKKESKKRGIKQNTKKIKQNSTKSNQKGKTTETAKKMKQNNTKTKQKKKSQQNSKMSSKNANEKNKLLTLEIHTLLIIAYFLRYYTQWNPIDFFFFSNIFGMHPLPIITHFVPDYTQSVEFVFRISLEFI
jgi:hypothetical protein